VAATRKALAGTPAASLSTQKLVDGQTAKLRDVLFTRVYNNPRSAKATIDGLRSVLEEMVTFMALVTFAGMASFQNTGPQGLNTNASYRSS